MAVEAPAYASPDVRFSTRRVERGGIIARLIHPPTAEAELMAANQEASDGVLIFRKPRADTLGGRLKDVVSTRLPAAIVRGYRRILEGVRENWNLGSSTSHLALNEINRGAGWRGLVRYAIPKGENGMSVFEQDTWLPKPTDW